MIRTTCSLFASIGLVLAQAPIVAVPLSPAPVVASMKASRAIDLVICLDVSGSMNGLIDAARQNLWAIVNDMATLQPQPELRVALLTYGNPEYGPDTGFVSIRTELTTDLDRVSQELFALATNGGDEYVARVVKRALDDLKWSDDPLALKMIFVAGNEAATQDPSFDALKMAGNAIAQSILVNAIYCGNPQHNEADGWRQVARLADGKFAAIEQDKIAVIETPFDKRMAELSAELNTTYLVYGKHRGAWMENQTDQDSNASALNVAAAAQRCMTKGSVLYSNAANDLCDAMKLPKFDLSSVKKEELPEEMRKMSLEEMKLHIAAMQKKRDAIQKQVAEIGRKRDAFVAAERKKRSGDGEKLFEDAILESVREQAKSRGFSRRVEPKVEVAPAVQPEPIKAASTGEAKSFSKVIEDAAKGYQAFTRVTGEPKVAPTMCRQPGPFVRVSDASKEHGGKLYLLYARHADGKDYIKKGEPAKVGQTLVKESWQRVKGRQKGSTQASKRYLGGLTHADGKYDYHAGDAYGLFVMHKLAHGTPSTDQGWIYGTIDPAGRVTAAGKVASCIKCHEDASNDRRFGLD